jgi:hypothetical protein
MQHKPIFSIPFLVFTACLAALVATVPAEAMPISVRHAFDPVTEDCAPLANQVRNG